MRRIVVISGIAVFLLILVVGGVFVWPSHMVRSGLDRLAATLPPGSHFTYGAADYSYFSHTVTLKDAALRFDQPAASVTVETMKIIDGNPDLQEAVNRAAAAPSLDDATETKIAGRVEMENVHSAYGPLDITTAHAEIDNPRVSLARLFAPLPPLQGGWMKEPGIAAIAPWLQKTALAATAAAYDKSAFRDMAMTVRDESSPETVTVRFGAMTCAGFDHGNLKSTTLDGFSFTGGAFGVTVDKMQAANADHAAFWTALRGGASLDEAAAMFTGANQSISGISFRNGPDQVGSIDRITLDNIAYNNGVPVSLAFALKGFAITPAAIPGGRQLADIAAALGYSTLKFDAGLSYHWNVTEREIDIDSASLTLAEGGTLSLNGRLTNATPGSARAAKLAAFTAHYQDASLATRWLNYLAKQTGQTQAAVKNGYVTWLEMQKPNFQHDPPLQAAFDGVEKFIADPRALTVTMAPPTPVGLADFDHTQPQTFMSKLGFTVTAN